MMPLPPRLILIGGLAVLPCVAVLPRLAWANGAEATPAAAAAVPAATGSPTVTPTTPLAATPVIPVVTGAGPAAGAARVAAPQNDTQRYCANIAAQAADARFAWQRKQLTDLQAQLKQRIVDLDAKETEFKAVMAKRDDMMKRAVEEVVNIYAKMKPDAAASQIAALDDDMAAAILSQLTPKQAGLVLNEIPTEKAAKLVTTMTAVATAEKKS